MQIESMFHEFCLQFLVPSLNQEALPRPGMTVVNDELT
jgi:hypothetical protein